MTRGPASALLVDRARGREGAAPPAARRSRVRRALAGFKDSCALCAVALLGCVALVALGTIGSLAWTFLVER